LTAAGSLDRSRFALIVALWLLSWLQPVRSYLPVPPMTIVAIAAMWLAAGRNNPRGTDGILHRRSNDNGAVR
jgi:hypothetical protein